MADERPDRRCAAHARALPLALEFLASELEARAAARVAPAAIEMVPIATFARERSLNPATVRQMAAAGRIEAVRIGKRQWRVHRDSPIRSIRSEERAAVSGRVMREARGAQLAAVAVLVADRGGGDRGGGAVVAVVRTWCFA